VVGFAYHRIQPGRLYFEEREVKTIQRLLLQLDKQTANLASVA